eukprot:COSAG01_NODE_4148_length_5295_cov_7.400115_6_plen_188_part_00
MMQGGAIVPQQLVPAHQRLDDLHRAVSYPQMPCTGIVDFVKRAGDSFERAELLAVVRSMGGVELAEVLMRWRVGGGGVGGERRLGPINIADTRETAARVGQLVRVSSCQENVFVRAHRARAESTTCSVFEECVCVCVRAQVRAEWGGFVVGWAAGVAFQKGATLGLCGLPDGLPMTVDVDGILRTKL